MNCIFSCLQERLGLFVGSMVIGALLALGAAVYIFLIILTLGLAALVALAGIIAGAAVTITACAIQCKNG